MGNAKREDHARTRIKITKMSGFADEFSLSLFLWISLFPTEKGNVVRNAKLSKQKCPALTFVVADLARLYDWQHTTLR
jgi:hypothetical protein